VCSGEKRIEKGTARVNPRPHPALPCSNNLRCKPATEPAIHGSLLKLCQKIRAHECFRHGSRHSSSFSDKTHTVCACAVWTREIGSGPDPHVRKNSEPSQARPSPALGAPHTDEFGTLKPEPSRTHEADSYVNGHH
jgi:hypothetical protein